MSGPPAPDVPTGGRGETLWSAGHRVRRAPEDGPSAAAHLEPHYEDMAKQTHAAQLGMWIFIASEILMFSALFALYATYRAALPGAFAEGAHHTNLWLGSSGTVVLLLASFLVALAVHWIRHDSARAAAAALAGGAALGLLFLGLKFWEYGRHVRDGILPGAYYRYEAFQQAGATAFFNLYYLMTGLHALHVIGGIIVLSWIAVRAWRRAYGPEYHTPLELGGMYWHFVDIVWLFLWPCFYLMRA